MIFRLWLECRFLTLYFYCTHNTYIYKFESFKISSTHLWLLITPRRTEPKQLYWMPFCINFHKYQYNFWVNNNMINIKCYERMVYAPTEQGVRLQTFSTLQYLLYTIQRSIHSLLPTPKPSLLLPYYTVLTWRHPLIHGMGVDEPHATYATTLYTLIPNCFSFI